MKMIQLRLKFRRLVMHPSFLFRPAQEKLQAMRAGSIP
jgi:hypothetical protein